MNETSMVTMPGGPSRAATSAAVRKRALTPSTRRTRGSVRSLQCSWPRPTSMATTRRAPRVEQHVGEAAGRGADVESRGGRDVEAEGVERVRELHAAAAGPRMIRADDPHLGVLRDHRAGLGGGAAAEVDLAGEDQRLRPLARLDRAPPAHRAAGSRRQLRCSGVQASSARGHDRRSTIQRAMAGRWLSARPAATSAASARAAASAASALDCATPNSAG